MGEESIKLAEKIEKLSQNIGIHAYNRILEELDEIKADVTDFGNEEFLKTWRVETMNQTIQLLKGRLKTIVANVEEMDKMIEELEDTYIEYKKIQI